LSTQGTSIYNKKAKFLKVLFFFRHFLTLDLKQRDFPAYIRHAQLRLFDLLAKAKSAEGIADLEEKLLKLYDRFKDKLRNGVSPRLLTIERRISKLSYSRRCFEASAVKAYERFGIKVVPGVSVSCVVVDAKRWIVEPYWNASGYDVNYYFGLLEKALDENCVSFF